MIAICHPTHLCLLFLKKPNKKTFHYPMKPRHFYFALYSFIQILKFAYKRQAFSFQTPRLYTTPKKTAASQAMYWMVIFILFLRKIEIFIKCIQRHSFDAS